MFTSEIEKRNLSHQQSFLMVLSLESYTLDYMSSAEKRKSLSLMTNRYDPYSPIEIPLERGNIEAQIEDKSDCFNLNLIVTNNEESKTKIDKILVSDSGQSTIEFFSGLSVVWRRSKSSAYIYKFTSIFDTQTI